MTIKGTPAEVVVIAAARRIIAEVPADVTGDLAFDLVEAFEVLNHGPMRNYLLANPSPWMREAIQPAKPAGVTVQHHWIPRAELPEGVEVPEGARGAWHNPDLPRANLNRVIWAYDK